MSRGVAIFAVVPWVVALVSVLGMRWQTWRALAEIAAVGEATRAELGRGFAERQAALHASVRGLHAVAARLQGQVEGRS
jgi:hypothetical protein